MRWWPSSCRRGDMIRVQIGAIWHYGIYVSDAEVIQFGTPPRGTLAPPEETEVCSTTIGVFSGGGSVEVARYSLGERLRKRSGSRIVQAARERLGERGYDILRNNCEHFATECVFGRPSSSQADAVFSGKREGVDVWVFRLGDGLEEADIDPPSRREEISRTGDPLLKRQRIADWQALSIMIRQRTGKRMRDMSFSQTPAGKWVCDGLGFSLSHSGDWVAVAVSDTSVGVDVEALTDGKEETLRSCLPRILADDEANACPTRRPADLLAVWTRKESVFKRAGHATFEPREIPLRDASTQTYISDDGWCLSVSAQAGQEVRLSLWDGSKTRAAEVVEWRMD